MNFPVRNVFSQILETIFNCEVNNSTYTHMVRRCADDEKIIVRVALQPTRYHSVILTFHEREVKIYMYARFALGCNFSLFGNPVVIHLQNDFEQFLTVEDWNALSYTNHTPFDFAVCFDQLVRIVYCLMTGEQDM